ncbi:class II aldolase/adducin head domain-containing protein [Prauserella endophytica]|uniref:Class II aldolase/adducin family protein n=1 Tax=Prauserella endophytica TaxID=1592324 RepID=A0ABY2S2Y0_9PSEU|nr:class II aldolase/adducin family protein [Prauserella endophytica]TKG69719.1 class II aldolase/adducin family protein [Prauserella endophytica]
MSTVSTELVAAAARLAELGLSPGSSGDVSVREGDSIVMSPPEPTSRRSTRSASRCSTQAEAIERLGLPFRAALLANHGLVVALDAAIELEEASKLLLLLGDRPIRTLGESGGVRLGERYGSPWGG